MAKRSLPLQLVPVAKAKVLLTYNMFAWVNI